MGEEALSGDPFCRVIVTFDHLACEIGVNVLDTGVHDVDSEAFVAFGGIPSVPQILQQNRLSHSFKKKKQGVSSRGS